MRPSIVLLAGLCSLAAAASDKPVVGSDPVAAVDPVVPSSKLSVNKVSHEDNVPTPEYAKRPLDPYSSTGSGADSLSVVDLPAIESSDEETEPEGSFNSFFMSISMIVVSEIGDKTFLIAALMAMKHSRFVVFTSAFASLVVMTVLLGVVGHALPAMLSQRVTQFLASILFLVFGFKLFREGLAMSKDMGVDEELAEVEEEIASSSINSNMNDIESGSANSTKVTGVSAWISEILSNLENLAALVFSPVWIQVFVMTFLGEWGDRSQIAIIAMAAGSDYWFVILGAIIGHGLCTFAACTGGKLLAKRISMRTVTLGGAIAFFVFAILYFYDAMYNIE